MDMSKMKGGKMLSKSPTIMHEKGDSAMQNTAVGSGARPTKSKMKIWTSAPMEPHTLGRAPPGWLK